MCAVAAAGGLWSLASVPDGTIREVLRVFSGWLPPGPSFVANTARSAGALVLSAGILLLSDAIGAIILRWCLRCRPRGAVRLAAALTGYAAVSTGLLGLACLGLWYGAVLFGFLGLAAAAGFRGAGLAAGEAAAAVGGIWRSSSLPARLGWLAAAAWWMFYLVAPEVNVDCMSYNLAFPEQILRGHRMPGSDLYLLWPLPVLADLPHVFSILLGVDSSARQVGVVLAVLGAMTVMKSLGRAATPLSLTLLASLVALLVPNGRTGLAVAKSDSFACAYALAAAGVVLRAAAPRSPRFRAGEAVVAGLLLGAVVATKWVLAPFAAALGAAGVFLARPGGRTKVLLIVAGACLAPFAPWLLKSYMLHADPLYPMGSVTLPGIFGNPATNAATADLFAGYIASDRTVWGFFSETLQLLFRNSFLLLAAAPLLIAPGRRRTALFVLAPVIGLAVIVLAMQGIFSHLERYTYSIHVLLNLVSLAAITEYLAVRRGRGVAGTVKLVSAVCGTALVAAGLAQLGLAPRWPDAERSLRVKAYLSGRMSADEFRREGLGSYGAVLPALRRAVSGYGGTGAVLAVGETFFWGIPARVRTHTDFEAPFVWRAVNESDSVRRLMIRFRQADVRWLLYNSELSYWARKGRSPYEWSARMLRLYADCAASVFSLVAVSRCEGPGFGSDWFYALARRPETRAETVPFLPGAEAAYQRATLAMESGDYGEAIRLLSELRRIIPGVAVLRKMLGHALVHAGRYREAHGHLRAAMDAGLTGCIESAIFNRAIAASRLGMEGEARSLLRAAELLYPRWPGAVEGVRAMAGESAISRRGAERSAP